MGKKPKGAFLAKYEDEIVDFSFGKSNEGKVIVFNPAIQFYNDCRNNKYIDMPDKRFDGVLTQHQELDKELFHGRNYITFDEFIRSCCWRSMMMACRDCSMKMLREFLSVEINYWLQKDELLLVLLC